MDQPKPSSMQLEKVKQLLFAVQEDELQHEGANGTADLEHSLQLLQLDSRPIESDSNMRSEVDPLTTLKRLPGRGIGIVATRPIPAGSILQSETATMTFPMVPDGAISTGFFTKMVGDYVALPVVTRHQILSLHAYMRPDHERAIRMFLAAADGDSKLTRQQIDFVVRLSSIWGTNSFKGHMPSTASLYLKTSRVNHSCVANCGHAVGSEDGMDKITIFTNRDIQPNEELTVPYLNIYDPREKRRANTKRVWGFVCSCPACDYGDPTVDTAKHENLLAEYRRLKQDSCLTISMDPTALPLPLKDLEEALSRSMRRAEIAESLKDFHDMLEEGLLSAQICDSKWLLTGHERDIKSQIDLLEPALLLAKKIPFANDGVNMEKDVEERLEAAKYRQGDRGRQYWAFLKENRAMVPPGDKLITARILLNAKLGRDTDPGDLLRGEIPLNDLPAELRALVVSSGHSLEEILCVAREELGRA